MGTRNKISDLNNHLFEQLERINDVELQGEDLKTEIQRTEAMTKLGAAIVENARIELSARRFAFDAGADVNPNLQFLEG